MLFNFLQTYKSWQAATPKAQTRELAVSYEPTAVLHSCQVPLQLFINVQLFPRLWRNFNSIHRSQEF